MSTEKPGVYSITHIPTGRRYIGSTINLSKRWSRHRLELVAGKHRNTHLQNTWNRDGADAFEWVILNICEPGERIALEQFYIDLWDTTDPNYGFNRTAIAGVSYGGGRWVRSPEWRQRMSDTQRRLKRKIQIGDKCPAGHVIDGTYTRVRRGRTGVSSMSIRCQECERDGSRERQRTKRG